MDFFEYNLKYRISETAKQIYSWNSITVETADQISQLNTWNSITVKTVITDTTVITAITPNGKSRGKYAKSKA